MGRNTLPEGEKKLQISVNVKPDVHRHLTDIADTLGMSHSAIGALALEAFISKMQENPQLISDMTTLNTGIEALNSERERLLDKITVLASQ